MLETKKKKSTVHSRYSPSSVSAPRCYRTPRFNTPSQPNQQTLNTSLPNSKLSLFTSLVVSRKTKQHGALVITQCVPCMRKVCTVGHACVECVWPSFTSPTLKKFWVARAFEVRWACTCCHDRTGFHCCLLPLSHFSLFFVSLEALHNPERSLNSRVLSTPASSNVLMTRRRSSSL